MKSRYWHSWVLLESLRENPSYVFSWLMRTAGNPWHSLAYRWDHTNLCPHLYITFSVPSLLLLLGHLPLDLGPSLINHPSLKIPNLITSAKIPLLNEVTFTDSRARAQLLGVHHSTHCRVLNNKDFLLFT